MKRFGIIFGSYLAASFVASFLIWLSLIAVDGFNQVQNFSVSNFVLFVGVGTGLTFIAALIPAGAFIIYCELTGRPGWMVHALAGALSGFIASTVYVLLVGFGSRNFDNELIGTIIVLPTIAGSISAIVYWKMAVAPWQEKLKPEQMVDVFD